MGKLRIQHAQFAHDGKATWLGGDVDPLLFIKNDQYLLVTPVPGTPCRLYYPVGLPQVIVLERRGERIGQHAPHLDRVPKHIHLKILINSPDQRHTDHAASEQDSGTQHQRNLEVITYVTQHGTHPTP